jgi:MerR family transcriptional regulator, copper efflux regulator
MKIGELAKRAVVPVSAVRYYEREGILPKPDTRESGYREYTDSDLRRLKFVTAAKQQRFSLALIKLCLEAFDEQDDPCKHVAEIVSDRIRSLDKEIAEMQVVRRRLARQLAAWKGGGLPQAPCLCSILETDVVRLDQGEEVAIEKAS